MGIGEPDRAVGSDRDVVGRIQPLSLEAVRNDAHRAVVLRSRHAPRAVLARNQATGPVAGKAVGKVRRLAINGQPGRRRPAVDPVVRNIRKQQAVGISEPNRTFGPVESRCEFFQLRTGDQVGFELGIDDLVFRHYSISISISRTGINSIGFFRFAARMSRRIGIDLRP